MSIDIPSKFLSKAEITISGLNPVATVENNDIVEKIEEVEEESKLGLYFKKIVAEYKREKLPTDTAKALLRIESSLSTHQNLEQLNCALKRIKQIEKICSILKADNKMFALKCEQVKERIGLAINDWKISMELTEAVRVA
jgi:hypothetical protein